MKLTRCLASFRPAFIFAFALALTSPLMAQSSDEASIGNVSPDALPSNLQKSVTVMVELSDAPAGVAYATALKQAQAAYDKQRNYALQHPSSRQSQAVLKQTQTSIQISSTAATQIKTAVSKIDQAQRNLLPTLTSGSIGGQVLFRAQRAYNGIAMVVSPDKIAAIAATPGVKAVHPMNPKYLVTTFSDIDFLNTRPAWTTGPFGTHGENIKVADIDTGLDYIHRNFGGSGSAADYTSTNDTSAVPNVNYPTPKIPGGIDLVGDSYNADSTSPSYQPVPHPDNNPLDCGGHGTATASLIAGFGETNAGFTYSGTYDAANPNMSTMKIPPGFAPNAKLYPVRVFGCAGSTDVVVQAIEWAMDPNGDGNFSDKMDVINMSLGANHGFADDPDDVAASIAASTGIIICSAAGNAGDSYYIHSSPAAAAGTLGVAASFNDQNGFIFDGNVTMAAPPAIAGQVYPAIFGAAPVPHTAVPTNSFVYAIPNDGGPDQGAGPYTPYSNQASINGKICLVDRGSANSGGSIGFATKIGRAKASGAVAVIVDNFNNPGQPPTVMGGLNANDNIPAVMITRTDRDTIVAAAGGFDGTTGLPTNATSGAINLDNGVVATSTNPPGTAAGAGSPDTLPTYTSRGPRLPDSATKPDITAPAEVVAVATSASDQNPLPPFAGTAVQNFNGTSSATPHVAGIMSLLKQLHPTWSTQELLALACNTSTHDLFTTVGGVGGSQIGVGRIGAGRVDVGLAAAATVVAYNGSDPNLQGVSFGVVETPVDGSRTVTKNITVTNKGATNITYNTSVSNDPALTGATFTVSPPNFTVNAGTSTTVTVTLTATGSSLKHAREASVASTQGGNSRQWLTEAGGYAVFTPTDASPILRVELYAAPKPISAMHSTLTSFVPDQPNTGSFTLNLSGSAVNTGASLGNGFDILSLVKAYELQYVSPNAGQPNPPTDRNKIKYVGITSDYAERVANATATTSARIAWGIEDFGDAPIPYYGGSDKEIFIDTGDGAGGPPDGVADFAIYLFYNNTGQENVYLPVLVKLHAGTAAIQGNFTNLLSAGTADTNIFNNSGINVYLPGSALADTAHGYAAVASAGGPTLIQYQVVTFDRNGNEVDETPVMTYDISKPGLDVGNVGLAAGVATIPTFATRPTEPFYYSDLSTNSIPVNYNGTNFRANHSLGVWLLHMHNGDGNRSDVVTFLKPTVTSFSPTSGPVGTRVTITGSNFNAGTTVTFFNNKPAAVSVLTSNTLVATVPSGAVTGPIKVSNAAGSSTAQGNFTVTP